MCTAHVNTHIYARAENTDTQECSSDNKHVFSWNTTVCLIGTQTCVHVNTHMCTREHTQIYAHPEHTHTSVHLKQTCVHLQHKHVSIGTHMCVHVNTHMSTRGRRKCAHVNTHTCAHVQHTHVYCTCEHTHLCARGKHRHTRVFI